MKAAVSRLPFAPPSDEIRADIETGRLEFTTRPGTTFGPAELRKAIEDAGYGVHKITVDDEPVTPEAGEKKAAQPSESKSLWWPF